MKRILLYFAALSLLAGCAFWQPDDPIQPPSPSPVPTQNSPIQTPESTPVSSEPTATVVKPTPTVVTPSPEPTVILEPTIAPSLEPTIQPTSSPIPTDTPTPEPCQIKPGTTYTIRPGDNFWTIADCAYGDPTRWIDIWRANPQVSSPRRLHSGNTLIIPHDR